MSTPATPHERQRGRGSNLVFKSGALLISSKGLGWKSWKRRWFVLTCKDLVFYKSDPNGLSKGSELNLALGGIDLNNSGSVLVQTDKRLLTVLFPDGRAFTMKAETLEDLDEWKFALEQAISAAPSAALTTGQSGIFTKDSIDATETPNKLGRGRKPVKSLVIGRPILLALEDIDGSPSFLEKALRFIEQYGVTAEGILRQSADVDEVELRVCDFEQGKNQFGPDEDAHVIGDCIKHVLRELPSLPVPTPCCAALLEAQRIAGKENQISAMRDAVVETFPEPNRRLLQRVLKMMRTVVAHATENRMTAPAVAACMAPLLLKPLLTGECGVEDDSDFSGDNSAQLLAAAAAANCAQAIITTLVEDYDRIFEGNENQNSCSEMCAKADKAASEASSDEEVSQVQEEDYCDAEDDHDVEPEQDPERLLSGSSSGSSGNDRSDVFDYKVFENGECDVDSLEVSRTARGKRSAEVLSRSINLGNLRAIHEGQAEEDFLSATSLGLSHASWGNTRLSPAATPRISVTNSASGTNSSRGAVKAALPTASNNSRRSSIWGSNGTKKKTILETANVSGDEELAIQQLEATRNELRSKIAKEAKGNAALQQSLERRKQALHDRRLVLEQDVTRLQEQLEAERELRAALEIGLTMSASQFSMTRNLDSKTRVEFEEIAVAEADVARLKQRVAELHAQLNCQRQKQGGPLPDIHERFQRVRDLHTRQNAFQQEPNGRYAAGSQSSLIQEAEIGSRHDHSMTLEQMVNQQRSALTEAKEALQAERTRGQNLRRHAVQQDTTSSIDWRSSRPPAGPPASGRQFSWIRRRSDLSNSPDSRQTEAVSSYTDGTAPMGDISTQSGKRAFTDVEIPNTGAVYQRQAIASSALAELTTRLDFFKERRSQLMEQLQDLDSSINSHPHEWS